MAIWTEFKYGPAAAMRAHKWVPDTGTDRPCLIYVPGGGWSRGHPSAFYDPTISGSGPIGEAIFLDGTYGIQARENTTPIVCLSAFFGSHRYDHWAATVGSKWDQDALGTAYAFGDLRRNDPSGDEENYNLYRCRLAHTSAADNEPGVGAIWADVWYEVPMNDTSGARLGECAMTPRYIGAGTDHIKRLVQWAKAHAVELAIDPEKIVVMGGSAGGQVAGCVAYDWTAPYYEAASAPVVHVDSARHSSKPLAAILKITPAHWRDFNFDSLMAHLWGRDFSAAEWDAYPAERKAALSPLGVLETTQESVPTYLEYQGSEPVDLATPWTGREHHADNGQRLLDGLLAYGQTAEACPFYHAGNAPSNWAQPMWDWLAARWEI